MKMDYILIFEMENARFRLCFGILKSESVSLLDSVMRILTAALLLSGAAVFSLHDKDDIRLVSIGPGTGVLLSGPKGATT